MDENYNQPDKDTYYFPHDFHARHDTKINAMMVDFGVEGYGMYWVLIELLYEQRGNKLEKFPKLFYGLAAELSVDPDRAEKFVLALLNEYRLLDEDETYIWSEAVLRRIEIRENKRLMKVTAGRVGGIHSGITRKKKQNEAPLQEIEANEAKERKVKESKGKNNTPKLSDSEFIESLKTDPIYSHIDFDYEFSKMDKWLGLNPGRKKTRRFMVNWLNKIERPVKLPEKESKLKFADKDCRACKGTGFVYNQLKSTTEFCKCRVKEKSNAA